MSGGAQPFDALPALGLDIVGDVHGHLRALEDLGRDLGYAVEDDWRHPEDRQLLFVGDLVDRGPASLEVCELVQRLERRGRALCLMGNHEYNLVGWHLGLEQGRPSNAAARADVARRPERWEPVLAWLAERPLALELPGLRVIHAVWHEACFGRVRPVLGPERPADEAGPGDQAARLRAAVVLESPFRDGALRPGLPSVGCPPSPDKDHEVLIKGFEEQADAPFLDADGNRRELVRVCWWQGDHAAVRDDGLTVFGHYWCLPPRSPADPFAPPYPTGHPELLSWEERHVGDVPDQGRCPVPAGTAFVCVDYNGVLRHGDTGCVGAFRWPDREVAWRREGTRAGD